MRERGHTSTWTSRWLIDIILYIQLAEPSRAEPSRAHKEREGICTRGPTRTTGIPPRGGGWGQDVESPMPSLCLCSRAGCVSCWLGRGIGLLGSFLGLAELGSLTLGCSCIRCCFGGVTACHSGPPTAAAAAISLG